MTTISSPETDTEKIDRVRRFFDQPANYLDRRQFDIRIRAETVATFLEGRSFTSILDIGCGDGSLSIPLLSRRCRLTLLDISANMLAKAKSRVPGHLAGNVKVVNGDFLTALDSQERYDVVLCVGVLAHVSSPAAVLDNIASLLNPGGVLVLEFTDSTHFSRRMLSFYHAVVGLFRRSMYKGTSYSGMQLLEIVNRRFVLISDFRYCFPWPGAHRMASQETLYRLIRSMFGTVNRNRNRWLGSEYICSFRLV